MAAEITTPVAAEAIPAPAPAAAAPDATPAEALGLSATGAKAITIRALLEAGAHLGHRVNRWNPKMRPYIYGARNGISIIDLQKSAELFRKAYAIVAQTTARGEQVLFVCTKKQGSPVIEEEARRAGQPFVSYRWLGGMLTNYTTIKGSVDKLKRIEAMATDGTYDRLTKRETVELDRSKEKLERNLGGIRDMPRLPGLVFIIDTNKESLAVEEATRLGIPVVAVIDTNSSPDDITYPIPANDDAIRVIRLIAATVAEACIEGARSHEQVAAARRDEARAKRSEAPAHAAPAGDRKPAGPGKVEVLVKKGRGRGRPAAGADAPAGEEGGDESAEA
jgi:small subunit ribosomal protein S2